MTGAPLPGRRPRGAAFVIAGLLAAVALVMLWDARQLPQQGGYAGVGPADVPRLVAWGLLILSGFTIVAGFRGEVPVPDRQAPAPLFWMLLGLGLQLVLLRTAGFSIASGLLFACAARALGQRPLWLGLAVGIVLSMLVYLIFDGLLRLTLPAGVIETLVLDPVIGAVKGLSAGAPPATAGG